MDESSPKKKFKLDLDDLNYSDDHIPTQKLFKAYQKGELSTSILSKDEHQPSTSSASSSRLVTTHSASGPTGGEQRREQGKDDVKEESTPSSSVPSSDGVVLPQSPSKKAASVNSLLVNAKQRGNPILKFIRNVAWEFMEMEPDYIMGRNVCALYLSLRYHNFNPNYIHGRIQKLGLNFELRVLLVQVDIAEPYNVLKELTRMAILSNMTLLLAWSAEEAGRYLETFKAFEKKPVDLIKEKVNEDYYSQATDFLTSVRSVNKTDVSTLLTQFGSIEGLMTADPTELSLCPGLGNQKAKRLYEMFRTPFPRR